MNYRQTIKYLYSALPMYHRVGIVAYKADLNNTIAICDLLNNPQRQLQCIHVAGTNGKGSVSHMLASIFQAAGYKTGLYTSPHLKDFRERIRINGKMIGRKYISEFVSRYKDDFDRIQPSFFEMTVGLAFQYFFDKRTDIAIIETGLGGRLDSTNVIHPLLSVITNIDWDHMNLLGNSLQKIAREKAGIIKHDVPVVVGESNNSTDDVFIKTAHDLNARLYFASKELKAELSAGDSKRKLTVAQIRQKGTHLRINLSKKKKIIYNDLLLDLTGHYQLKNVVTVIQSIFLLNKEFNITDEHIRVGLSDVKTSTGLSGRWQIINNMPLTIADTGHNSAGITAVLKMIETIKYNKLHFVISLVNDKETGTILSLLPRDAEYYFCKAAIPRGLDVKLLAEEGVRHKLKGNTYKSVKAALSAAKNKADENDLIIVGGSNFTVAEVI